MSNCLYTVYDYKAMFNVDNFDSWMGGVLERRNRAKQSKRVYRPIPRKNNRVLFT